MKSWHILLCFLLISCSAVESPKQTSTPTICAAINVQDVSDAIQHDTQGLAAEFGISTDEAICRILMMEASGELNARLEQFEADTFAGLWMLHQPEFRVIVAFTRDGEKIIQPYIKNSILDGIIEVREAAVTQAELYVTEMEAHQLVEGLGLSLIAFTLVNTQENQVEIHIPNSRLLDERLAATHLELPDHVEIITDLTTSVSDPPSNLTPAPGVHFPQLVAPTSLVYAISTSGQLEINAGCLRLVRTGDDPGPLLIWQPSHYLNSNQGVVEVLDHTGKVLARVGELSCFSPAAGELSPDEYWLLRSPLPQECTSPNFLVGNVQLAYQENRDSTLIEVELIDLETAAFYFIRAIADLDEWVEEPIEISGKLVRHEDSRCLRIQLESQTGFQDYLVFWPPGFTIREESGAVVITNGLGEVVARLNEEVRLFGGLVMAVEEIRLPLNDELPCDCVGGAYWVVIDGQDNK